MARDAPPRYPIVQDLDCADYKSLDCTSVVQEFSQLEL